VHLFCSSVLMAALDAPTAVPTRSAPEGEHAAACAPGNGNGELASGVTWLLPEQTVRRRGTLEKGFKDADGSSDRFSGCVKG